MSGPDQDETAQCSLDALDNERKYLEDNLSSRSNFYFVFMGAIVAGAFQIGEPVERGIVFLVAGFISLFFWRALFRTHVLVDAILDRILEDRPYQPYPVARKKVETQFWMLPMPRNANLYVAQYIPGVITFSLLLLGSFYLFGSQSFSDALTAFTSGAPAGEASN